MGFKKLYISENTVENTKSYKDLKNILSGFLQKEATETIKRPKGLVVKYSPIGSWTTFTSNLKNQLPGFRFVDSKSDKNQLAFKNNSLFFWTRLVGRDAFIYITTQNNPKEPDWGEDVEAEETETAVDVPETPPEEVPQA